MALIIMITIFSISVFAATIFEAATKEDMRDLFLQMQHISMYFGKSSNLEVAKIDSNGNVWAQSAGETTITAEAADEA